MGEVKYRGISIYSGPLAEVQFEHNWCDSMAEYYPRLWVKWLELGELKWKQVEVPMSSANDWYSNSEVIIDLDMAKSLADMRYLKRKQEEHDKVTYHKLVKVIKGRKVPIGTEGEVFWMGDNGYGMSVGLRLLDDSKVFTAIGNVKVISIDELLERDLLKVD